jgi:2'-5' RNA ligase
MRRLFFALWPEPAERARLQELAALASPLPGARALAALDLHVTLCFLGSVSEAVLSGLLVRANRIDLPAFELEFDAVEHWREARILAATATAVPAPATALVHALSAAARELGLNIEDRPWRAHVTLARGIAQAAPAAAVPAPPLVLFARRFYLAQSQRLAADVRAGADCAQRYCRLGSWMLRC